MCQPSRLLGRAVFGAAVLAALGLGTAQAFAEPVGAEARACDHGFCNDYCVGAGYFGGSCVNNGYGGTKCLCY